MMLLIDGLTDSEMRALVEYLTRQNLSTDLKNPTRIHTVYKDKGIVIMDKCEEK